MLSYDEPKFIEIFHWEGDFFFQISAKIEMKLNKNRLFCRHFEKVQHFHFFFRIMIFYIAYINGANFIPNFAGKVVFNGWVPRNPLPLGHQQE